MGLRGPALNLKQFMLQRRVIKLYRDLFRATKGIQNESTKRDVQDWIRNDFKKHAAETDEYAIKMLILNGERSLRELQSSVSMSQ